MKVEEKRQEERLLTLVRNECFSIIGFVVRRLRQFQENRTEEIDILIDDLERIGSQSLLPGEEGEE